MNSPHSYLRLIPHLCCLRLPPQEFFPFSPISLISSPLLHNTHQKYDFISPILKKHSPDLNYVVIYFPFLCSSQEQNSPNQRAHSLSPILSSCFCLNPLSLPLLTTFYSPSKTQVLHECLWNPEPFLVFSPVPLQCTLLLPHFLDCL